MDSFSAPRAHAVPPNVGDMAKKSKGQAMRMQPFPLGVGPVIPDSSAWGEQSGQPKSFEDTTRSGMHESQTHEPVDHHSSDHLGDRDDSKPAHVDQDVHVPTTGDSSHLKTAGTHSGDSHGDEDTSSSSSSSGDEGHDGGQVSGTGDSAAYQSGSNVVSEGKPKRKRRGILQKIKEIVKK